ncbi:MAG: SDR family NAD(P)-dependent oxidoreductase [Acidobacteriota bacterium]
MKSFEGRVAAITGGGTGMGRELAKQLTAEGCHVALCDVAREAMNETIELCREHAPDGVRITAHDCDVSSEEQIVAYRDGAVAEHGEQIHLLFNNAGIGGGGSFVESTRAEWDKVFDICWGGVYYGSRAFLPHLMACDEAHLVNTSSVNGFWASLGPGVPHTAYSAAKFAVKGFSEALINDLRLNAPHVNVSLVMPGHIGTSIAINSGRILDRPDPLEMTGDDVAQARRDMARLGMEVGALSDDDIRQASHQRQQDFLEQAPMSAADAAKIILDGVREKKWRILVGDDAQFMDALVRSNPEEAYSEAFMEQLASVGHLTPLTDAPDAPDADS